MTKTVVWLSQIEEKVHFGQFSSIFFLYVENKKLSETRNINVSKSLMTCTFRKLLQFLIFLGVCLRSKSVIRLTFCIFIVISAIMSL